MELQLSNLSSLLKKITEVTGLPAYFNDRTQTTSMIKLDLRYKGFNWKNYPRIGEATFDLVLICSGIGEEFIRQLINTEMKLSVVFEELAQQETTEIKKHEVNAKEKIKFIWNTDLGTIEYEDNEKGTVYTYKRYFQLCYEFKNLN